MNSMKRDRIIEKRKREFDEIGRRIKAQ